MAITYDVTTGLRALDGSNLISDIDAGLLSMAQDISNQRHALQAGVIDSGSYMAVQKAAGANMSVDVGSNSGRGMYVSDASSRLVFVAPTGSATNVAVTTAHATLPRIDIVTVSSAGVVAVTAGTATSGATLTNRTGAASVASGSQLIADILVAATVTSIGNAVIRDRRPWARGAYCRITASTAYTRTSSTAALVDSTNLNPRIECSGVPLLVTFRAYGVQAGTADDLIQWDLFVDSSVVANTRYAYTAPLNLYGPVDLAWEIVPAAGSHLVGPAWSSSLAHQLTIPNASSGQVLTVRELPAQNTANNTTTSG